ncbi:MAG: D-glycero-beta-D-manno-heptose 1-phosphate adenylyltransferase [Acidobacteria bacterium]|nr:D-glycero-beta-D-manno-heptose 1-phosphate adenylyltransferase [Acidobacteriota bacterium]
MTNNYQDKIINIENIPTILSTIDRKAKKIVFTNGCFDILHYGHVKLLWEAKALGDILFLGLNSDDSIKRIKGKNRPINPEFERSCVLASLQMIDYISIFEEDTPMRLIKIIKPDILVKGGDWTPDSVVGSGFVSEYGGEVKIIPLVDGLSTTNTINKLKFK